MKIAVLLPDLRVGGVERMRLVLAREWKSLGCEVIFIVLKERGGLLAQVKTEFTVHNLDANRMRDSIWKLRKLMTRISPDILLVGMWPLTVIGLLSCALTGLKIPVHVSEHISFKHTPELKSLSGKVMFWLTVTLFYRLARSIICVSDGVKRDIRIFAKPPVEKFSVIYNPAHVTVEVNEIKKTTSNSWRTLLSVGSLKPQKDYRTLVEAFSLLAPRGDVRLVIVGDGPERADLVQLVGSLGLSNLVYFEGEQLDLAKYFLAADVFVLSSLYEGFANVIVEAMSYGLQVVSTDCEHGPREILKGGEFGKLVPISDPRAMADAINEALNKPFRSELVHERSRTYAPKDIAKQYLTVFNSD